LFRLQKEIVSRISGDIKVTIPGISGSIQHKEREEYFELLAREFVKNFDTTLLNMANNYTSLEDYKARSLVTKEKALVEITAAYDEIFEGKESELGHYFRSLYHLVKYVDEARIDK